MTSASGNLPPPTGFTMLFSEMQIHRRIAELATEINAAYEGNTELMVICILKGGFMFLSDLVKGLVVPCRIEFVRLASYGDTRKSSGTVEPVELSLPSLGGKDVLLVEDIVDTGLSMDFLLSTLRSIHAPRSLRLVTLIDKPAERLKPVKPDWIGFEIDNAYVIGYGLDDAGLYRNLPFIARLNLNTTDS
jgi:hypoxanthine phosphoribosyltransferase